MHYTYSTLAEAYTLTAFTTFYILYNIQILLCCYIAIHRTHCVYINNFQYYPRVKLYNFWRSWLWEFFRRFIFFCFCIFYKFIKQSKCESRVNICCVAFRVACLPASKITSSSSSSSIGIFITRIYGAVTTCQ